MSCAEDLPILHLRAAGLTGGHGQRFWGIWELCVGINRALQAQQALAQRMAKHVRIYVLDLLAQMRLCIMQGYRLAYRRLRFQTQRCGPICKSAWVLQALIGEHACCNLSRIRHLEPEGMSVAASLLCCLALQHTGCIAAAGLHLAAHNKQPIPCCHVHHKTQISSVWSRKCQSSQM